MQFPAAIKWLVIGGACWAIWRVPVIADDYAQLLALPPSSTAPATPSLPALSADSSAAAARPPSSSGQPSVPAKWLHIVKHALALSQPVRSQAIILTLPPPSPSDGQQVDRQQATAFADATVSAGDIADRAYARLRAGDRAGAAHLLARAETLGQSDPRARNWAADRRELLRRWHGDAYVLVRRSGTATAIGTNPTLAGSQAGVRIAYVLTPLAKRPLTLAARAYQPLAQGSGKTDAAQAALAIELQPDRRIPVTIAVDRYIALGSMARDDWALRVASGANDIALGRGIIASYYAQAGVIGVKRHDGYADGQLRIAAALMERDSVRLTVGPGIWGGAQPGAARLDIGPTMEISGRIGQTHIAANADWRWRAAGNARPGHGPALTVRAGF